MRTFIAVLCSCSIAVAVADDGSKLATIYQDAHRRDDPRPAPRPHHDHCHDDDLITALIEVLFEPAFWLVSEYTLLAPFTLPHLALEGESIEAYGYPEHPYDRSAGFLRDEDPSAHTRSWSVQLVAEGGRDFDGVTRWSARGLAEWDSRIGVAADIHVLDERVGSDTETAVLDDVQITFRFAEHPRAQMRFGIGARLYHFDNDTDGGIVFTYSGDVFPVKPLVVSYELSAGNLGSASALGARLTAGAMTWQDIELYAGYDYLDIGSTTIQGPLLGLRYWW
jgi:hypothetical protein